MNLSPHFSLMEFTKSATGIRAGIDNTPTPDQIANLAVLCNEVLEHIRDHFGPVRIVSGFRCLPLNILVGGAKNSQHCNGEAADIEVPGVTMLDLFTWCRENVKFDQLALEFVDPNEPHSGWIHISYGPRMRGEVLVIDKHGTKTWQG